MEEDRLLQDFATSRSEEAFRALVDRHIDFVYSVALRQLHDPHRAQEVAQMVFIDLAGKASRLPPGTILAGWLFRATRFAAAKLVRSDLRRQHRERQAAMDHAEPAASPVDPRWQDLEPVLNEALDELSDADRDAVLLRFFEKKALHEIAAHLGLNEATARKRVGRAVDKLRRVFVRRGVAISVPVLTAALLAQSSPAAPAGLAATVTGLALQGQALAGMTASTTVVGKGILKLMALSKLKIAAATTGALLVLGGTVHVIQYLHQPGRIHRLFAVDQDDDAILRIIRQMNSRGLAEAPPRLFLRASGEPDGSEGAIARNGRFMGHNVTAIELIATAYNTTPGRLRLANSVRLPAERFDYLVSLDSDQRTSLQNAIREKLGLSARLQPRTEDVYVLTARAGEFENLRPSEGPANNLRIRNRDGELSFENATVDAFARSLEHMLERPIVDESGLQGRFDIHLLLPDPGDSANARPSFDAVRKAASEQLGLELKRDQRELEMLVVDHAGRG